MKQLKRKDQQLTKQMEDLEITLKSQETKEALNKLPVDETDKKMREQILTAYDPTDTPQDGQPQDSDSQEQPSDSDKQSDQQSDAQSEQEDRKEEGE